MLKTLWVCYSIIVFSKLLLFLLWFFFLLFRLSHHNMHSYGLQSKLQHELTCRSHLKLPICVAVFSPSNPSASFNFLHAILRTNTYLAGKKPRSAKLYVYDLSEQGNTAGRLILLTSGLVMSLTFSLPITHLYIKW